MEMCFIENCEFRNSVRMYKMEVPDFMVDHTEKF